MDRLPELEARLDALRPLSPDHINLLWPQWRAEDALFVYATNAVEGSTLVAVPGIGDATEFIGYMAELERQQVERYLAALRTAHGDSAADRGGMS